LAALAFSSSVKADDWNKKTVVTFSQPVEIPGDVVCKKSRKLSYKDAARTFQAICKPRLLKLAKSGRGKKAARQEIEN
jgi:hypothetical protein